MRLKMFSALFDPQTINEGIVYWRTESRDDLPFQPPPELPNETYNVTSPDHHPKLPTACTDSDLAGNIKHRKSVTGHVVVCMAGGPVLYKSRLQPTVSLSSTEAEFVAATDTGKSILCLRSILEELNVPVHQATDLHIDNAGARMMGNSLKPTKRTHHLPS